MMDISALLMMFFEVLTEKMTGESSSLKLSVHSLHCQILGIFAGVETVPHPSIRAFSSSYRGIGKNAR
jgi:hypothetical protein